MPPMGHMAMWVALKHLGQRLRVNYVLIEVFGP